MTGRYTFARWPALFRFLDVGRIELDTNTVERAIRPMNHLFTGSDGGADRRAMLATLITTEKLNDIDPQAWLADVFERMTSGHPINRIDDLLPWNWSADASTH